MKKKEFKIAVLVLLVVVGLSAWGILAKAPVVGGTVAQVTYDGKEVLSIPLNGEPGTFTVKGAMVWKEDKNGDPITDDDGNKIEERLVATLVRDEKGVKFINSVCPDHLCEQQGYVKDKGDTAVCMPGKISVTAE